MILNINIDSIKNIHFVGIGGSGVSSVASLLSFKGKNVTGSDKGLAGHNEENIYKEIDLVVYSIAVPLDNPELLKAKKLSIPIVSYPELLRILSENMKTIAVAGTHGKTTTTAMIASVLEGTQFNPTVIVGAKIIDFQSNALMGNGEYLLVEADEYRKSFLNLYPEYLVITNIDEDHLDFYKDLKNIQSAFTELASRVPEHGVIVCNPSHPHILPVIKNVKCNIVDYTNLRALKIDLQLHGQHNRENACCAYALAQYLDIENSVILEKLMNFKGVSRRFEYKGTTKTGAFVYDDYAHNPQKIRSAISGAREKFPDKNIVVVFQPHLYSRTKKLLKEFASSFKDADKVLIPPIYGAREVFDPTINSEMLVSEINQNSILAESFRSLEDISERLVSHLSDKDVVLLVGAGNVTSLTDLLMV